jgi:hypothetical protein
VLARRPVKHEIGAHGTTVRIHDESVGIRFKPANVALVVVDELREACWCGH